MHHASIRAWYAVSKDGTSCGNSSSVTLVKSRNSVGRDCRSANRTPAMGGASCHCLVRSEAHHTIKRDKLKDTSGRWQPSLARRGYMVPWPTDHVCYLLCGPRLPDRMPASACSLRACHLDTLPWVPLHPPVYARRKISAHA